MTQGRVSSRSRRHSSLWWLLMTAALDRDHLGVPPSVRPRSRVGRHRGGARSAVGGVVFHGRHRRQFSLQRRAPRRSSVPRHAHVRAAARPERLAAARRRAGRRSTVATTRALRHFRHARPARGRARSRMVRCLATGADSRRGHHGASRRLDARAGEHHGRVSRRPGRRSDLHRARRAAHARRTNRRAARRRSAANRRRSAQSQRADHTRSRRDRHRAQVRRQIRRRAHADARRK